MVFFFRIRAKIRPAHAIMLLYQVHEWINYSELAIIGHLSLIYNPNKIPANLTYF